MEVQEVLFVILEQYADWEAAAIAAALNEDPEHGEKKKYIVKTVSLDGEPVTSIGGFKVLPDYSVDTAPEDFAGLILIGGNSWRKEESRRVVELVERAQQKDIVVGAICAATVFLGMNGKLNSAQHTSNQLEKLKEAAGGNYTAEQNYLEQQAVRDGKLVTANGSAYLDFGREILYALNAAPDEEIEEWYSFFKKGYHEFMKEKSGQ
ncbi:type 1 glutamine amidotransferase family protein [Planococcus halotolerans]|uniref:Glutamine amidotransferase n=1 Tax=Planococcus halotolerans TaxID=2233542 RepID=A0A365KXH6_9BACL|nr:type 1 glutamine amidotransferase family protein [Planococcus halotolerans]QHJ72102.1 glutamine amidotransferase [Planococcus halotolerans]RAZ77882.1 glutamine amidotransferase [Planococcus halotolerans]